MSTIEVNKLFTVVYNDHCQGYTMKAACRKHGLGIESYRKRLQTAIKAGLSNPKTVYQEACNAQL
jgi:hypothetical protein